MNKFQNKQKSSNALLYFIFCVVLLASCLVSNYFGKEIGIRDGFASGKDSGYSVGYEQGKQDGYHKGYSAGYEKGTHDGYRTGYAAANAKHSSSISSQNENFTKSVPGFGLYIGNVNTQKFHVTSCSYLPDPVNRVYFGSREDAVNAGYSPCGHCDP